MGKSQIGPCTVGSTNAGAISVPYPWGRNKLYPPTRPFEDTPENAERRAERAKSRWKRPAHLIHWNENEDLCMFDDDWTAEFNICRRAIDGLPWNSGEFHIDEADLRYLSRFNGGIAANIKADHWLKFMYKWSVLEPMLLPAD